MNPFEAEALRQRAAAKTIDRLRADRHRASSRIRPLVEFIERNLFDPALDYERIRATLAIRDNNRTTLFRRELGLTPAAYVRDCRMEVACRLLRDTDLEVAWVAEQVGYGSSQVFGPAFKRYAGVTPTWFRRRERTTGVAEPVVAGPVPDLDPSAWRRFVTGELALEEAAILVRHVLDRYPDIRRRLLSELLERLGRSEEGDAAVAPAEPVPAAETLLPSLRRLLSRRDVEALMAELAWEEIERLPWSEQIDALRRSVRFSTPAYLHLLGEKARAAPPGAARVQIARLAVEYASVFDESRASDGTSSWKALAWAWLGDARRLASDPVGAAKAFALTEGLLADDDPSTEAALARRLIASAVDEPGERNRLGAVLRLDETPDLHYPAAHSCESAAEI